MEGHLVRVSVKNTRMMDKMLPKNVDRNKFINEMIADGLRRRFYEHLERDVLGPDLEPEPELEAKPKPKDMRAVSSALTRAVGNIPAIRQ